MISQKINDSLKTPLVPRCIYTILVVLAILTTAASGQPVNSESAEKLIAQQPPVAGDRAPTQATEIFGTTQKAPLGDKFQTPFVNSIVLLPAEQRKNPDTAANVNRKQNAPYQFPNARTRFNRYVNKLAGPGAFLGAGIGATIDQFGNNPPEWKKNGGGFARRYASTLGINAISASTEYGISELFRQDQSYRKCDCQKFFPRFGHALLSGITARQRNGKKVFSPAKIFSPYAGGITAANSWYPKRFGVSDGVRLGTISLGSNIGFNLIREFIFR